MIGLHETCQQYFDRRLREGWKCISRNGPFVVLLSPEGIRKELDLRHDIETLRPNAAGDLTEMSPNTGANWQCVDEAVADDDVTYVQATFNESYQSDLYHLPASSGLGTINSIKVYFCVLVNTSGDASYPLLKEGGTLTTGTVVGFNVAWTTHSQTWTTNPRTGSAWQWSEIDALQIGIKIGSAFNIGTDECTQVYVEVDYTPAVSFVPQIIMI